MPDTSSEMVERVARAVYAKRVERLRRSDPAGQFFIGTFDSMPGDLRHGYFEDARAAIEAMREPTDAMSGEMARVAYTLAMFGSDNDRRVNPRCLSETEMTKIGWGDHLRGNPSRWYTPHWRAAIDAALKDDANG